MEEQKKPTKIVDLTALTLIRIGKAFCIVGTAIPFALLLGRIINYEALLKITPGGLIVMNPLSSVCFIVSGISLWLMRSANAPEKNKKVSRYLCVFVVLVGLGKLFSLLLGLNFSLDLLLFREQLHIFHGHKYMTEWNEMAPNTAINFVLLGITIWLIDYTEKKVKYIQYINYLIVLISLLSLYGYIYGVQKLYGVFGMVPMSFYTALCFLFFSVSVLFLRPLKGTMAILIGENPAEVVLLRFIALVLPLIIGWLKIKGEHIDVIQKEFGTAIFAVFTYVLSMALIARKSSVQHRLRKARKKIIDLIEEDNLRLKRILDNSPTYISIYDVESDHLVYTNNPGKDRFGTTKELMAKPYSKLVEDIVHPEDVEKMKARLEEYKTIKEEGASRIEFRMIDRKGEIRWLYSRAIVFKNEENGVKQVLINSMDFTNFKRAQQEILEQKKFIGKILEASPNVIYIYDIKNRENKFFSRNFFEPLGYTPKMLNPLNVDYLIKLIYPKDLVRLQKHYEAFRNAKKFDIRDIEYRIKDVHGKWRWAYSRETVFERDEDGKVLQVVGVLQDITSRKNAEKALKYREIQLVEAQKIAHVGSYEWNLIKDEITYTAEAYRIFGFPTNKTKFRIADFKSLLTEEDLIKYEVNLSMALEEGNSYESEFRIRLKDNTQKTILNNGKIVRDSKGKPFKIFGTIMDISSQKLAEAKMRQKNEELYHAYVQLQLTQRELKIANKELEDKVRDQTAELKAREERYKSFISQSSEGIFRFEFRDIDGVDTSLPIEEQTKLILKHAYIAEANDMMAWMHGYDDAEEMLGTGLTEFIVLPEEAKVEMVKKFVLSEYKLVDIQTPEVNKQGELNHYASNIDGVVKDGKLLRGWGTQVNITQKVRTIEALKISEEKYRFLAENAPELFWTALPDGTIDYHNKRSFVKNHKASVEEQWKSMVHPDDLSTVEKLWEKSIQSGSEFLVEYRLKSSDNHYRWNLGKASPIKDKYGKIIKWTGTSTDIHEGKMLSEKLVEKNEELMKINSDLDNFIYTASHDLKVPITNIEGLLYMLLEEMSDVCRSDKDVNEILMRMNISVNKFKKIISDLTEISRAQKGKADDFDENDLSEVLDEVIFMLKDLIETSNATIMTNFSDCESVYFSRSNLKNVLYNLICNSIKYASPERIPEIKITCQCKDGYTILSIQDNGIGLDVTQLDKAFSMFKKLHSHKEGSGIGLYIVKRIVTNAGGKIEVESTKGNGATFKIYLKGKSPKR